MIVSHDCDTRSNKGKSTLIKKEGDRGKIPVSSLFAFDVNLLTTSLQLRGISGKGEPILDSPSQVAHERYRFLYITPHPCPQIFHRILSHHVFRHR